MPVSPQTRQLLDLMASLNLPAIDSLSAPDARTMMNAGRDERPPGPDLPRVEDRSVPGPAGDIPVRLYASSTATGLPIVVYFHGGGWVLGDLDGDDPACRTLAAETGALVVSVNYRHAPEDRFPAAVDDAIAATTWIGAHGSELGGDPSRMAVCGWSAGGNLAAVVAQLAKAAGGPALRAQALVTPVTDCDFGTPSYQENANDYVLTRSLMGWFWDHYLPDATQRTDPRASPLQAKDLSGLPPALVLTAEFDPLRDEGEAYAAALVRAGVPVTSRRWLGDTHLVWGQLGILDSSGESQAWVSEFLRRHLS
jgi:acetyl esterase/lipase